MMESDMSLRDAVRLALDCGYNWIVCHPHAAAQVRMWANERYWQILREQPGRLAPHRNPVEIVPSVRQVNPAFLIFDDYEALKKHLAEQYP